MNILRKKKFLTVITGGGNALLGKDVGQIPFYVSQIEGWKADLAYLKEDGILLCDKGFEKNCNLICMGDYTLDNESNRQTVIDFIKAHIREYDVVNFYNYGSNIYIWSYYCKKYNPNIFVYSKLDMGNGGFNHFCGHSFLRNLKNYFERFKSQYIDLFSVETFGYYEELKNNIVFKNKIIYFPNGIQFLDNNKFPDNKENIILHVARIGAYEKNTELLLESLNKVKPDILKKWKIYLIGPYTVEFKKLLTDYQIKNKLLKEIIILTGNIEDKNLLYSYYSKSKIFVLTSRYEGFPLAPIEALYYKNYLLLSNYGSAAYDITNNEYYGKVINSFDSDIWAKELEKTMTNSNIEDVVKDAPNFVKDKFNYQVNVIKLLKRIETIISKNRVHL